MELTANHVRIHYEVYGEGAPLLLLHGNGESLEIYDRLIPRLSHDHRVYAIDSRCHGKSEDTESISYDIMADDMISLVHTLGLQHPVVYGFSDGGIIGLITAMKEPDLLSQLIVSGVNLNPDGLKASAMAGIRRIAEETQDKLYLLMAREPNIPAEQLGSIRIPVHLLVGEHDLILPEHTQEIAAHLADCTLEVIPGENHDSYIVHSHKLYPILKKYL